MKKNMIAKILVAVLLMLGIVSSAWAGSGNTSLHLTGYRGYSFDIQDVNKGYNSPARNKQKGFSYATCQVDVGDLPTNFLVIASDGMQITYNIILKKNNGLGWMRYYSQDHEGMVKLRANSGSTTVGYRVSGEWNPNEFICD